MRSLRDSPEPLSSTRPGIAMPCGARKSRIASRARRRGAGRPGLLGRQRQEQRARHRVARELVDQPDDLGERQRVVGVEQPRVRAAARRAACRRRCVPPVCCQNVLNSAVGELRRAHDRARDDERAAADGVAARRTRCGCPSDRRASRRRCRRAPRRQGRGSSAHVLSSSRLAGPRDWRSRAPCRRRSPAQAEGDRLEIHQQRVGQDVVGAVGLVVEGAAVVALRREVAVVDDHVAGRCARCPAWRRPLTNAHQRSAVMNGSPPPTSTRLPSSTWSRTGPVA